tara:strand:+ start:696 stop:1289 length:594 start_codon:yes stop_codon:yes gene_type:complete
MRTNILFPTAVSMFNYNITDEEKKVIYKLKTRPNTGNTVTVNTKVLDITTLKKLKKFILKSVDSYFTEIYAPKYKTKPYVTQSWCNYTKKGEYHHKHSHANSFISGVYYVSANKESDKIYFYKNEKDVLKVVSNNYNSFNSSSWWLPVETGLLILFPSYLAHSVDTVTDKDTRISLSFNTFLKGDIGDDIALTRLVL